MEPGRTPAGAGASVHRAASSWTRVAGTAAGAPGREGLVAPDAAEPGGAVGAEGRQGGAEDVLRQPPEGGRALGAQSPGHGGFEPFDGFQMVRHHGAIGANGFRQEFRRLVVRRRLLDHLVECAQEIELADIADLREGGGDPAPVENTVKAGHREGFRLAVQPPDPRAVLGGPQSVPETQDAGVEQPPVVDPRPGVRVVDRGGAVGGEDRVEGAQRHLAAAVRHPVDLAGPPRHLDVVDADEVRPQSLGGVEELAAVAGGVPVVPVQERQVGAAGRVQAGVAGRREAAVGLVGEQHGAGHLLHGPFQQVPGAVRRTVVDQEEFDIVPRVRLQAAQSVGRELPHVVERHDDGELDHGIDAKGRPRPAPRSPRVHEVNAGRTAC
ncbi:hypothetical protein GA0115236_120814 [Streptomyces sp. IgraMP-1]|nr:hypothetical protein GA0115236_120814 [Streptomyces sp. IgraMP-1]